VSPSLAPVVGHIPPMEGVIRSFIGTNTASLGMSKENAPKHSGFSLSRVFTKQSFGSLPWEQGYGRLVSKTDRSVDIQHVYGCQDLGRIPSGGLEYSR
jgi:hypothetical protein